MGLFVPYHMHSDLSLLDSCTKFEDYIDAAVDEGLKAVSISEHGLAKNWTDKWLYCREKGIKYIHSVEMYLTETLDEKVRDNYHTVLIARNMDGVAELNRMMKISSDTDHFYYKNRISFTEFLNMSDNIISTSACLASPLAKLDESNQFFPLLAAKYDFYEVQPHNHPDQVAYNKKLYNLSRRYGKPLIAATDAHSINKYKDECRTVLLKSKNISYDGSGFDLTYKSYDQFVEAFRAQGSLPEDIYLQAIDNTNRLDELCEPVELDVDRIKTPILYGSAEKDTEIFEERTWEKFEEKIRDGVIPPEEEEQFRAKIPEELETFKQVGMSGFMLSMEEFLSWCKSQKIPVGPGRGSVTGSAAAYINGITDVDSVKWKTVFSRFCNVNRVEPPDVDIDLCESDRPKVFKYIIDRFGEDKTSRVSAFGTLKEKATIDEIGRAFRYYWEDEQAEKHGVSVGQIRDGYANLIGKCPWSLNKVDHIKKEFEDDPNAARKKYEELFYYYDGLLNTRVSQSVHPAGMIVADISLTDTYGSFYKDGEVTLLLDMDASHEMNLVKYDFLLLSNIEIIKRTCEYAGIKYPMMHEIDFDDKAVWEDMMRSPYGIFQMSSPFAFDSLKKLHPTNIFEMSLVAASIRPSGASYRDKLLRRIPNKNPSKQIDDLLSDNIGYLVYQEDIIAFLQEICGLDGSTADSVRRGIAKKKMSILEQYMPQILDGYCSKSDKPRDIAEEEAKEFLQIIEDASSYMFGYNHSVAYSIIGYLCAYFRYYYTGEFITAYLNIYSDKEEEIRNGAELAKVYGIKMTTPKFGLSRSHYEYNKESNTISRGLESVKFISKRCAETLYELAHSRNYNYFVDLLADISNTDIDTRQMDILRKLDFFSDFGNQRELEALMYIYNTLLKSGDAKSIRKEKARDAGIEEVFRLHANGLTKAGKESVSWTGFDAQTIARSAEDFVKSQHIADLSLAEKARNYADVAGYVGFVTGVQSDRSTLYVKDVQPVKRKKDGKLFGYAVFYQSIGSGIENRMTVFKGMYDKSPIKPNDVIRCLEYTKDGKWFQLLKYTHVA